MRIVLVTVCVALLTACSADSQESGAAGGDDRLRVVASFFPLAQVVERVGGEDVVVENLTPAGAEPHDLELKPSQVDTIEDAALVVYIGRSFQPAVEQAAKRAQRRLDVMNPLPQGARADDPHLWLDPTLMTVIVDRVEKELAAIDDSRAGDFSNRADAFRDELRRLDEEFDASLGTCERRVLVTAHDAFGYLARRYELENHAVSGLSPDAEPSPARLAELVSLVRSEGVTTVFYEALVSPRVAETLARDAGVATDVLDPIEGVSEDAPPQGATYVAAMRANLVALQKALSCQPAPPPTPPA